MFIDPNTLGRRIVVLAPHVDDEVLACGGTIARLQHKSEVHFVYATDGSQSPRPPFPRAGHVPAEVAAVRAAEARASASVLGVPALNLHFLGFPDGQLQRHRAALGVAVSTILDDVRPHCVLAPFRYDRHPDHLALNRAATAATTPLMPRTALLEYFIYYRSRLLPGGDLRRYVHPDQLVAVDIQPGQARKREALECFKSQTTRYFAWQDRPILTRRSLDEVCDNPELYVRYSAARAGAAVFCRAGSWVRLVHSVEPRLKRHKDRGVALLRQAMRPAARSPQ